MFQLIWLAFQLLSSEMCQWLSCWTVLPQNILVAENYVGDITSEQKSGQRNVNFAAEKEQEKIEIQMVKDPEICLEVVESLNL